MFVNEGGNRELDEEGGRIATRVHDNLLFRNSVRLFGRGKVSVSPTFVSPQTPTLSAFAPVEYIQPLYLLAADLPSQRSPCERVGPRPHAFCRVAFASSVSRFPFPSSRSHSRLPYSL